RWGRGCDAGRPAAAVVPHLDHRGRCRPRRRGTRRPPAGVAAMDVLSSRIILRPENPALSRAFYRDTLGLAVHREFGDPENPGMVFFCGNGLLEVSGQARQPGAGLPVALWMQVRELAAEHSRLEAAGVRITREPRQEPW